MTKSKVKKSKTTSLSANVFLRDERVGEIVHSPARGFFFEYDPVFRARGVQISPLKLPLQTGVIKIATALERVTCFSGLPGVFADSLPDRFGNELLTKHFEERGFNPAAVSPLQKLLYVGNTGMGALEYRPMENTQVKPALVPLEIRMLVEQAKKVIRGNLNSAISELMSIGTSAGGARAKGLIGWDRKSGDIVAGVRDLPKKYEHWIIKFDGTEKSTKGWGKIEYTYAEMARLAGIKISETHLLRENGRNHFMTKRFDRVNGKKIHMHSLCGMVEIDYNEHRLFDYVSFAREVLRITGSYQDLEQVFYRAVFNLLARNQDDHLKNFAFLMNEKGAWSLAPAYDLCFSLGGWCDDNQMTFDGKLGQKIKLSDLHDIARKLGVKKPEVIISKVNAGISKWKALAKLNGVSSTQIMMVQKAHDERRRSVGLKAAFVSKKQRTKAA
jgi:serine/threonine-protein kinase HipA